MNRRIAIGDIHGCELTLRKLLFDNLQISKEDEIFLLGDLIDRGPRIREVIDDILQWREYGYKINIIKGNHEWLLLKSLKDKSAFDMWMLNKGMTTLQAFSVNDAAHLPAEYLKFFKKIPAYIELDDFILVHGGLNFEKKNPLKHKKAMVWTRNEKVRKKDIEKIGGKRLIVGHTPVPLKQILKTKGTNKIMTDGGCVYKGIHKGLGFLVAYDMDRDEFFYEENIDY
jgi:serine/threonine protein phosphatase 1